MHKRKGRRGRPKVRCSPRGERALEQMVANQLANEQPTKSLLEPDLSAKRIAAVQNRWDASKIMELDLTTGVECEIFSHEEDSSDEDMEEIPDTAEEDLDMELPKTSAWRYWKHFQEYLPADLQTQVLCWGSSRSNLTSPA